MTPVAKLNNRDHEIYSRNASVSLATFSNGVIGFATRLERLFRGDQRVCHASSTLASLQMYTHWQIVIESALLE